MSSPWSLFDSFKILVMGVLTSVLMFIGIGQITDIILNILILDANVTQINSEWAASFNRIYVLQSLIFIMCLLPAISGLIVFIIAATRKQKYEYYNDPQTTANEYEAM